MTDGDVYETFSFQRISNLRFSSFVNVVSKGDNEDQFAKFPSGQYNIF